MVKALNFTHQTWVQVSPSPTVGGTRKGVLPNLVHRTREVSLFTWARPMLCTEGVHGIKSAHFMLLVGSCMQIVVRCIVHCFQDEHRPEVVYGVW